MNFYFAKNQVLTKKNQKYVIQHIKKLDIPEKAL